MTQDEKWLVKYREVMDFIQKEQRKPSKYYPEEKLKFHYIHHNKKLYNAGGLKAELSGNCTVELMAWFDNDDPEFSYYVPCKFVVELEYDKDGWYVENHKELEFDTSQLDR